MCGSCCFTLLFGMWLIAPSGRAWVHVGGCRAACRLGPFPSLDRDLKLSASPGGCSYFSHSMIDMRCVCTLSLTACVPRGSGALVGTARVAPAMTFPARTRVGVRVGGAQVIHGGYHPSGVSACYLPLVAPYLGLYQASGRA